jgi:hypothetical protein
MNVMNFPQTMDYSDAKAAVQEMLRPEPKLATTIRRVLSCRIVDKVAGAGRGAEPTSHHEREAALHIRKMVAEGEILEEMQGKRLYYKSPLFL